jgi:hypothetical protein
MREHAGPRYSPYKIKKFSTSGFLFVAISIAAKFIFNIRDMLKII